MRIVHELNRKIVQPRLLVFKLDVWLCLFRCSQSTRVLLDLTNFDLPSQAIVH